jgi:hypothetical protein
MIRSLFIVRPEYMHILDYVNYLLNQV